MGHSRAPRAPKSGVGEKCGRQRALLSLIAAGVTLDQRFKVEKNISSIEKEAVMKWIKRLRNSER